MLITTPKVVQTEPLQVAMIRLRIPRNGMGEHLPPALEELYRALHTQGIAPAGPWFAHHVELPDTHFHFHACVPVASPVQPTGRVEAGSLPAMTAVGTLYRGPYTRLAEAWGEFRAWTHAQQLRTASSVIERYLINPVDTQDPEALQTELLWPLQAAPSTDMESA